MYHFDFLIFQLFRLRWSKSTTPIPSRSSWRLVRRGKFSFPASGRRSTLHFFQIFLCFFSFIVHSVVLQDGCCGRRRCRCSPEDAGKVQTHLRHSLHVWGSGISAQETHWAKGIVNQSINQSMAHLFLQSLFLSSFRHWITFFFEIFPRFLHSVEINWWFFPIFFLPVLNRVCFSNCFWLVFFVLGGCDVGLCAAVAAQWAWKQPRVAGTALLLRRDWRHQRGGSSLVPGFGVDCLLPPRRRAETVQLRHSFGCWGKGEDGEEGPLRSQVHWWPKSVRRLFRRMLFFTFTFFRFHSRLARMNFKSQSADPQFYNTCVNSKKFYRLIEFFPFSFSILQSFCFSFLFFYQFSALRIEFDICFCPLLFRSWRRPRHFCPDSNGPGSRTPSWSTSEVVHDFASIFRKRPASSV